MQTNDTNKVLADGGMLQDGGTKDPVSGNDVPVGSLQEEVRDDVPAQLSEGEFVFPADVVRYIGLDRLMKLREQAKNGLSKMEDMGQMGNAEEVQSPEEQTMDDHQFGSEIDSILAESEPETQQYAIGGDVVKAIAGTALSNLAKDSNIYANAPISGFRMAEYISPDGKQNVFIPMVNGDPLLSVPAGYSEKSNAGNIEVTTPAISQPAVAQTTTPSSGTAAKETTGVPQTEAEKASSAQTAQDIFEKQGDLQGPIDYTTIGKNIGSVVGAVAIPVPFLGSLMGQYAGSKFGADMTAANTQNIIERNSAILKYNLTNAGYDEGIISNTIAAATEAANAKGATAASIASRAAGVLVATGGANGYEPLTSEQALKVITDPKGVNAIIEDRSVQANPLEVDRFRTYGPATEGESVKEAKAAEEQQTETLVRGMVAQKEANDLAEAQAKAEQEAAGRAEWMRKMDEWRSQQEAAANAEDLSRQAETPTSSSGSGTMTSAGGYTYSPSQIGTATEAGGDRGTRGGFAKGGFITKSNKKEYNKNTKPSKGLGGKKK